MRGTIVAVILSILLFTVAVASMIEPAYAVTVECTAGYDVGKQDGDTVQFTAYGAVLL